jgi:hypothetical protein
MKVNSRIVNEFRSKFLLIKIHHRIFNVLMLNFTIAILTQIEVNKNLN